MTYIFRLGNAYVSNKKTMAKEIKEIKDECFVKKEQEVKNSGKKALLISKFFFRDDLEHGL